MPFGVDDAVIVGSALAGGASNLSQERDRTSERAFDIDTLRSLIAELEQAPLRDRLQYNLGARLGMSPREFRPNVGGMFGMQGAPQQGGIDQGALASSRAGYTPGAGGVDTQSRQILARMLAGGAHMDQSFGRNYVPGQSSGPSNWNAPPMPGAAPSQSGAERMAASPIDGFAAEGRARMQRNAAPVGAPTPDLATIMRNRLTGAPRGY